MNSHRDSTELARLDAKPADPISDILPETVLLRDAAWYLNVPDRHERLLLGSGFIHFAPGGARCRLGFPAVSKASLDIFLVKASCRAKPGLPGVLPIPLASRMAGCGSMEIVAMLLRDRLVRVGLDPDDRGYLAILVDVEEIRSRSYTGSITVPHDRSS